MKYYLTGLLLFITSFFYSQNQSFTLSGTVISADGQQPLESATIYLERIKDSTLLTYTISNQKGTFEIQEKTTDKNLRLNISYIGYQTFQKIIEIDKEIIELGNLEMVTGETLDEVLIRSRAPITIKKDTLEFNVKSFKTKKDATVEDLLKKLPGVEVDDAGNITVNGKAVNKILVNGKPFFGDDPTITTRNLTKEIIEKVQVTDTKTDAQAFAGEDTDGENKTINLTIKEENNKGVFGRLAAGGGTNERWEAAGFFNYFDNDQRISVLAGGNNINSPGFSFGEINKFFGGGNSIFFNGNGSFGIDGRNFGGGQGIVASQNAGVNYADTFGEKLDVSGDYFYSGSDGEDRSSTQRENILPDSRFFTNSNSSSTSDSDNHSVNVEFNIKVDSTFLINIRPSLSYRNGRRSSNSDEESSDQDGLLTNTGTTNSFFESEANGFENELEITKRFGSRGSFIKLSLDNEWSNSTSEDFLTSLTEIFGDTPETIFRNQFTDGESTTNNISVQATYRYPLISKKLFLDARFDYQNNKDENINSTFDFDDTTQTFSLFNQDLSTDFTYTNSRSTPSLALNYRGEKLSGNARLGYVFRTLENEDDLRDIALQQDFEAFEFSSYSNYRFSPKASVYGNYRLSNNPPGVSQIQPFQDVSDPLNIITGNPNLEPTNRHSFYLGYNEFDFQKRTGINVFVNGNVTNDQVVANTIVDENFVRNTTYANVNGNYGFSGSASYSRDIKIDTLRTLKYRVRSSYNTQRAINFNNGEQYASTTNSVTPNLQLTFNWKDILDIIPSYGISFTSTKYDLDTFDDRDFLRHTARLQTATFLPKKLEWRNDINYSFNPDVAPGFQQSAWFWNSTVAYSILKDQGTITLKVYDLLNQNTNARRTATQNFIQDSQSLVLQRYFLLSFSWKFNSLGKKGEADDGGVFFFD